MYLNNELIVVEGKNNKLSPKGYLGQTNTFGFSFFQLLATSSHQKLLHIVKCLTFQLASIKITLVKTVQNQHKHRISRTVAITGNHHFLYPKTYI